MPSYQGREILDTPAQTPQKGGQKELGLSWNHSSLSVFNSHASSEWHSSYRGQTLLKTAALYLTWKTMPTAEYCHRQAATTTSMHCHLPYLQNSLWQQQGILDSGYPFWLCVIWRDFRISKWAPSAFLQNKEVLHVYISWYLEGRWITLIFLTTNSLQK